MNCINKFNAFIVFCVIFSSVQMFSQTDMNKAWQKVDEVKLEEALEMFIDDAEKNPTSKSYLAAAYLEEILLKRETCITHFLEALKRETNPAPFLIAAMHSPRITENIDDNIYIVSKLKEVAESTDDGFIQTYMYEKIGKYYEDKAQLDSAIIYFNKMGAVKTWNVIGPFENISGSGFYTEFPPEKEFIESNKYQGKENKKINWFEPAKYRRDGWVDFLCYFSDPNSIFYGNTFVYSEERQKVQIRIGTSGSLRAFLNDQLIIETYTETNNNADTFIAETYLQKGWNRLLIKAGYSEINYCNFMVRITDERGFELKNLKFSAEGKEYPKNKKEEYISVKSTVEKFFEDRLAAQPDNPVNYLLLAEAYSINHKSYETEIVYNNGMKKFPQNVLFPIHLAGKYMRDNNTTMYYTLIDKADKRREDIPIIVDSKLAKEMSEQNKNNFISIFEKYQDAISNTKTFYKNSIFYNAIQGKVTELVSLVDSAYKKYPYDYDFVFFKANLDYTLTRNFDSTIEILEKYIVNNYSPRALDYLQTLYIGTSNWEKWRGVYNILLAYEPAEASYYYEMAQKYNQTMDYELAIDAIKSAISISPFNSDYYYLLGMCYNATNNVEESKKAYQLAIQNNYTNYNARDQIKLINKDNSIDDELGSIDIEKIITDAPGIVQYPTDDAVTLMQDMRYLIYEGGAYEFKEELFVRVLNDNGVDWYSNVNISSFANQTLSIEKAVVIKNDGSRIEGEINQSQIVFKSLEKNDFIYVKYKLRNHNKGLLSGHLWEMQNFNSFQPIKKIRFAIILPEKESIIIRGFNIDEKPDVMKTIGSNKLMIWEKENVPAIEYEYYMPTTYDIGPNIYLSTLRDWSTISKWYYDLTRSKLREHYIIKDKVAELLSGKENLSEREKIRLIYDFITKEISYVYVPFLQSEFVPQKASDVLINKIGDCKDVTTLFIAMLNEIGIKSDYVLVRTIDEGKLYNAPAGMFFNHVIAVTYLDGQKEYHDLTAVDYPCYSLPEILDGVLAIEIKDGPSEPFYLHNGSMEKNFVNRNTHVILNEDNSASVNIKSVKSGDTAVQMRTLYKGISGSQRIKKLTEVFSTEMPNFTINSFNIDNLDLLTIDVPYDIDLTINSFISKTGNYRIFKIPWSDALTQNTALSYNKRDYPYIIYGGADCSEKIEVLMPGGYEPLELPENISLSCDNASCKIKFELINGKIVASREYKFINRIITPEKYISYKEFYNKVMENEKTQILLKQSK